MKKALVTGADGFIGSHLTELLIADNYKVRALSYYNSFNYWGWLEDLSPNENLEIVTGDIRDPHFCKEIVNGIDIIFHLAALIAIPYSYISPASFIDTNIKGTFNICQAAKEAGILRLIHTSTSEVYGTAKYVPIDELHSKQPQSPYSASKIGADAIALSFHNSFGLPVTVARPFNTYGPRQSARAIIPSIIIQIANKTEEIKVGDLTPTRDFSYVTDTCKGFIELSKCDSSIGQEVNISSGSEISMYDLLTKIAEIMDFKVKIINETQRFRPNNSEVYRLCGDNTKIKFLTGFTPSFDLESGLRETIRWYTDKDHLKKYKTTIYNV